VDTLEIEISASHNNSLPPKLEFPEQLLFLAFRHLHASARNGTITREQAHAEKIKLLDQFDTFMRWDRIYQDTCKMRVKLGGLAKEMTVSDCQTCRKTIAIIDGRKI
jgi:hypothetical protein